MHRLTIMLAATAMALFMMAYTAELPTTTRGQTNVSCTPNPTYPNGTYAASLPDGETLTGNGLRLIP